MSHHGNILSQSTLQEEKIPAATHATKSRARNRRPDMQLYVPRAKRLQQNSQILPPSHLENNKPQVSRNSRTHEEELPDSPHSHIETTSSALKQYNGKLLNRVSSDKNFSHKCNIVQSSTRQLSAKVADSEQVSNVKSSKRSVVAKDSCENKFNFALDSFKCSGENTNCQFRVFERLDTLPQQAEPIFQCPKISDNVRELTNSPQIQESFAPITSASNRNASLNCISHKNCDVDSTTTNNNAISKKININNLREPSLRLKSNFESNLEENIADNCGSQTILSLTERSDKPISLNNHFCCEINSNSCQEINVEESKPTALDSCDDAPTTLDSCDDASTSLNSCIDTPTSLNSCDDAPTALDSCIHAPTSLDSCIDAPTPLDSCDNATTPLDSCEDASTPLNSCIDAPTPLNSCDDAPTPLNSCDDAPTALNSCDDAPTVLDSCIDAPTPLDSCDDAPTPLDSCDDAPTPLDSCEDASTSLNSCIDSPTALDSCDDTPTVLDSCIDAPISLDSYDDAPTPLDSCEDASTSLNSCIHASTALDYCDDAPTPLNSCDVAPTALDSCEDASISLNSCIDAPTALDSCDNAPTPLNSCDDASTALDSCDDVPTALDSSDDANLTGLCIPDEITNINAVHEENNSIEKHFQINELTEIVKESSINNNKKDKCESPTLSISKTLHMCEVGPYETDVNNLPCQTCQHSLVNSIEIPSFKESPSTPKSLPTEEPVVEDKLISSCASGQQELSEEDTWDIIFDDNGECLKPDILKEISSTLGTIKIERAKFDYSDFQPHDVDIAGEEFGHIIEIFGFSPEFKTNDLVTSFSIFKDQGFDIKWVDDTHALGVFSSPLAASEALALQYPLVKVRPLSQGIRESKLKAKKCSEFLQPYRPRPETSASLARRLVSGALGLKVQIPKEQRDLERQKLKEAKERRRQAAKQSRDVWDGVVS